MNIYEITIKLIGEIEPVGETNTDNERLENLKNHIELIELLLIDLGNVVGYKERVEFSMKRAGKLAHKSFKIIKNKC